MPRQKTDTDANLAIEAAIAAMRAADNELAKLQALRNGAGEVERNGGTPDAFARLERHAIEVEQISATVAKGVIEQGRSMARKSRPPNGNATESAIGGTSADTVNVAAGDDAEFKRLAKLPVAEYEKQRVTAAQRLGFRTSILDKIIEAERQKAGNGDGRQGRPLSLPQAEPWPETVDGAQLLTELANVISRYMVLPDGAAETVALWTFHTYCYDAFSHSPRLAITSPEKQCGKTTLLDILRHLVARPLSTSNATTSAVFRAVDTARPTLLIDEADTFLKDNDELRGILNAGHRKGEMVTRTVGDDHEPRQFSTWAPAAIALIGQLPDTLHDRAVECRLRRRKPSERVQSFRGDRAEHLQTLARKMTRWTADNEARLSATDPDMGDLQNRVADNWRPLFALADTAGRTWPARVREIAGMMNAAHTEQSNGALLLADIRDAFAAKGVDRLASEEIVAHLVGLEDRPWPEFHGGKPLSKARLARILGRFEVVSGTIRLPDGRTPKGYYLGHFADAFARYLPSGNATTPQRNNDGNCGAFQNATSDDGVAFSKSEKPLRHSDCGAVAFSKGGIEQNSVPERREGVSIPPNPPPASPSRPEENTTSNGWRTKL